MNSISTGNASVLKRVARFVGIYVVAAAGVWQAADVAFEALGLPPSAIRLVVVGALAMLPLVAVIAWVSSPAAVGLMTVNRRRNIVWSAGVAACVGASALAFVALRNRHSVEMPEEVALARIRETLFSGALHDGSSLTLRLAERDDVPPEVKLEAYRYLARAAVRAGDTTEARSALDHMLDLEPPVVLLHPAVEAPELIALYNAARRSRMALNPVGIDLDSAVFSIGPIAVTGIDGGDREALQSGVQEALITELALASELRIVDRSKNTISDLVEVGSNEQEVFYRAYSDLQAGRVPGKVVETHVITGSLGVSGDRMLVALWALDLQNATIVAHGLAEGQWPSEFWETMERSARELAADLKERRK